MDRAALVLLACAAIVGSVSAHGGEKSLLSSVTMGLEAVLVDILCICNQSWLGLTLQQADIRLLEYLHIFILG